MAKVKMTAAVTLQEQLAADIYDMRIKAPEIAESAVPGQFVSLYSKDGARILPRPISLCGIDKEKGELRLVSASRGKAQRNSPDSRQAIPLMSWDLWAMDFPCRPEKGRF